MTSIPSPHAAFASSEIASDHEVVAEWMIDLWLLTDGKLSRSEIGGLAALSAATESRTTVELCCVSGKRARVGLRVSSDSRPDPQLLAEWLTALVAERGSRAVLWAPPVVAPYIAPKEAQQRAAVEAASAEMTDLRPVDEKASLTDDLDGDQARIVGELEEGMSRDAPWFEQDPDVASEQFRAAWWADHLGGEEDG